MGPVLLCRPRLTAQSALWCVTSGSCQIQCCGADSGGADYSRLHVQGLPLQGQFPCRDCLIHSGWPVVHHRLPDSMSGRQVRTDSSLAEHCIWVACSSLHTPGFHPVCRPVGDRRPHNRFRLWQHWAGRSVQAVSRQAAGRTLHPVACRTAQTAGMQGPTPSANAQWR